MNSLEKKKPSSLPADPGERPSEDPRELGEQLRTALEQAGESPYHAELYRAFLVRFQVLAWRGVADGDVHAPERLRDTLREVAAPFIAKYSEELPTPEARAAAEVWFTLDALGTATRALAERRVEERLSQEQVSLHDREILRVLAASREKLRRGQVFERMKDPPTLARVGQILSEMFYEGLLNRVHGRAQGNPNSSFYTLSAKGRRVCLALGILLSHAPKILKNPDVPYQAFQLLRDLERDLEVGASVAAGEERVRREQRVEILEAAMAHLVATSPAGGPARRELRERAATAGERKRIEEVEGSGELSRVVADNASAVLV